MKERKDSRGSKGTSSSSSNSAEQSKRGSRRESDVSNGAVANASNVVPVPSSVEVADAKGVSSRLGVQRSEVALQGAAPPQRKERSRLPPSPPLATGFEIQANEPSPKQQRVPAAIESPVVSPSHVKVSVSGHLYE